MKSILSIKITDTGKHWRKEIRLFGITVYSRHDFTEESEKRQIGFNTYPIAPIDIEDEEE